MDITFRNSSLAKAFFAATLMAFVISIMMVLPMQAQALIKLDSKVAQVGNGNDISAALMDDGALYIWSESKKEEPAKVAGNVKSINMDASVYITNSGDLYQIDEDKVTKKLYSGVSAVYSTCWGWNLAIITTNNDLYIWDISEDGKPTKISGDVSTATATWDYFAYVTKGGALYTIKKDGTEQQKMLDGAASVTAGSQSFAAIKTDGSLWTWTPNVHDELEDGTYVDLSKPVKVLDGVASATISQLNCETYAAIKTDGSLYVWGSVTHNEKGDRDILYSATPKLFISDVADFEWVGVSSGGTGYYLLKKDGTLSTWGKYSKLIVDDTGSRVPTAFDAPVKLLKDVTQIGTAAISDGAVALCKDGAVYSIAGNESVRQVIAAAPVEPAEKTGTWKESGKKWWYRYDDGTYPKSCWAEVAGKWYHFDKSGWMETGWQKFGKKWYLLDKMNGFMVTGWKSDSGCWYYLDPKGGAMKTGWLQDGKSWYLLSKSGPMLTGWQKSGSKWYYMNGSGVMQSGKWVGNYYLQKDGSMATNRWIGRYHVNASGLWDKSK